MIDADRKKLYGAIHATRAKIGGLQDEETWRMFLRRATGGTDALQRGKDSLRDMDGRELGKVLDRLNAGAGQRAPLAAGRPVAQMARALWLSLYNLGLVDSPHDRALNAFIARQTGIEQANWLDTEHADAAIEALKAMAARAGYVPTRYHADGPTPMEGSFKPGLIEAQWRRLNELGAFKVGVFADVGNWLWNQGYKSAAAPAFLTNPEADQVIRELGAWVRRLTRKKVAVQ